MLSANMGACFNIVSIIRLEEKFVTEHTEVDGMSVAREKPESHRLQHVAYFFG